MPESHEIWPPEFDALKIGPGGKSLHGRLKKTGEWREIDLTDTRWLNLELSDQLIAMVQAWVRFTLYP